MTPEERRDQAIAQIHAAGGCVYDTVALAHPDQPHAIVAYRLHAGAPTPDVIDALAAVREATETDLSGLITWTEEVTPDAEPLP